VTVGYPITKGTVDNQLGAEIGALAAAFNAIAARKAWLDHSSHNQAFMTGLGYTTTEDDLMRAAITDLDSLRQIARGTGPKGVATIGQAAAANQFFFNALLLGGITWFGP
jgi:hypothetical protein